MKKILFSTFFGLSSLLGLTQNIDSPPAASKTLELKISNPQPRVNQSFEITLDVEFIRADIFRPALGKMLYADSMGSYNTDLMKLTVVPTEKGKNEIGPLQFTINGNVYSTNKIEYEVIDTLPNIDEGLWIRKVTTGDNTFSIIVEQRIPENKVKAPRKNAPIWATRDDHLAVYKSSPIAKGFQHGGIESSTMMSSIYDEKGMEKKFKSAYAITNFEILDKTKKIIFTKDMFENIPAYYKFEDIVIQ